MSRIKTLLMALIFVLGAMYVWKFEVQRKREATPEQEQQQILAGISLEQIKELSVVHGGGSYSLERKSPKEQQGAAWVMKKPKGAPVNMTVLNETLQALVDLKSENTIAPEEVEGDQKIYGLSPPELLVIVKGEFGKRVLSFGKKHSLTERRYLQPEKDGSIYLVDDEKFKTLNKSRKDLRDHQPLKFEESEVHSFSILANSRVPLLFKRAGKGKNEKDKWTVRIGQGNAAADTALINKELKRLSQLQVRRFVDTPGSVVAVYGLARPKFIINISLFADTDSGSLSNNKGDKHQQNKSPREYIIQIGEGVSLRDRDEEDVVGRAKKALYMKIVGKKWIYELEPASFGALQQPPQYFRDRRPFLGISSKDISRVRVSREASLKDDFALIRDNLKNSAAWRIEAGVSSAEKAEPRAGSTKYIEQWLGKVLGLTVLSYDDSDGASEEECGFGAPLLRIQIELRDGKRLLELLIGSPVKTLSLRERRDGQQQNTAPRFGRVFGSNQEKSSVVISSALIAELNQPMNAFVSGSS